MPAEEQEQQQGSQARTLKRERCAVQQVGGSEENAAQNRDVPSPSQQQLERRRRLSGELCLAASAAVPALGQEQEEEAGEQVEAGLATLSLLCSPKGAVRKREVEGMKPVDLGSLRMRLRAALGVT
jgi:hypothetical protein